MGVKISQLPGILSANSYDELVLNHESQTKKITVEALMESYLAEAGYVNESGLADYFSSHIGDYLSEFVTLNELDDAGYLTGSDLSDYLSEYVKGSDISSYLSEYVKGCRE